MADDTATAQRHIDQLRALLGADVARLATAGAKAGTTAARGVVAQLGPMRNMGRRGVRLTAGYDLAPDGGSFVIALKPPGAWVIVQQGAKTHTIRPRRRRGTGAALAIGHMGTYRAVAHGAHASGRNGISRTFTAARAKIPGAIHDEQVAAMRGIFGG